MSRDHDSETWGVRDDKYKASALQLLTRCRMCGLQCPTGCRSWTGRQSGTPKSPPPSLGEDVGLARLQVGMPGTIEFGRRHESQDIWYCHLLLAIVQCSLFTFQIADKIWQMKCVCKRMGAI